MQLGLAAVDDVSVALSAGTTAAGIGFGPNALLPREPWRPLSNEERTALLRPSPHAVCIRQVDVEALAPLRALLTQPRERLPLKVNLVYERVVQELNAGFQMDTIAIHGIAAHEPAMPSVTWDNNMQEFIGLHVDSWDNCALYRRAAARYRFCINIGTRPRHFHFVNLTVSGIHALLMPTQSCGATDLGRRFLTLYPDYPVVRVTLRPGEAYIAPTDNLVHDAATPNGTRRDYTFTFRGMRQCPPTQATEQGA